jgi:hypothetical protein
MALSLLVLLVPLALVIGFYRVVLDGDRPATVDPRPAIADARAANAFPVAEPVGLDAQWQPTSALFRRAPGGATLRIGYVGPGGDPVLLVQSSVPGSELLPAELGATARAGDNVPVAGRTWQRYVSGRGEQALVLAETGRTVVIVGATTAERVTTLAAALR